MAYRQPVRKPISTALLSRALGASVSLQSKPPASPKLEEYWPDMDNLAHRETVTEEAMPPDTFFDGAVVHILTTATLKQLQSVYPQGSFEARRFRPNLIVAPMRMMRASSKIHGSDARW